MLQKFIPDYYVTNTFAIPMAFFHKHGIKYVLCDLDNTLDSYRLFTPSKRVEEWKQRLNSEGIELLIISNNHGNRVQEYCHKLAVDFSYSTRKPFIKRLLTFLDSKGIDKTHCALIGDQLLTDVACGKKSGILTILTEPLVKEDQWTTRFNRLIDRPLRKHLKKKGKIVLMEDEQ